MGLSESRLTIITKPFSFLSHCKVSCDSPCCQSLCGENNNRLFNIDIHEISAIVIVKILINVIPK